MKKSFLLVGAVVLAIAFYFMWKELNKENQNKIYDYGRKWIFAVKSSNRVAIDTLSLEVVKLPFAKTRRAFRWIMSYDSSGSKRSDTSITESDTKITSGFPGLEENIEIPPPSNLYMKYSPALPSPFVRLPIYEGYTSKSTTTHNLSTLEALKGQTSTGVTTVTGKTFYENTQVNDSCWVVESSSTSPVGSMRAKYYFHEKVGFVYLFYDFNTYQVEMDLLAYILRE